jgi:hypothetical protein
MLPNNRQSALGSLSTILGGAIYINPAFFSNLAVLEDIQIGGSLLLDITFNATIARDSVSSSSYGSVDVDIFVNQFETNAFFNTMSPIDLDLPLEIPSGIEPIIFALSNGTFDIEFIANIDSPLNLLDLFSGAQNATSLNFEGSLDAHFPLSVGTAGVNIGIDVDITDDDLFDGSVPEIEYQLDLCETVGKPFLIAQFLRLHFLGC